MSATLIATYTPKGPYFAPSAGQLDPTLTAADVSNGNSFNFTGREILMAENTDASPHHITLTSTADSKGRTGDVTSYAVGANTISFFKFRGGIEGWQQGDGTVHFSADNALVKFLIIDPGV